MFGEAERMPAFASNSGPQLLDLFMCSMINRGGYLDAYVRSCALSRRMGEQVASLLVRRMLPRKLARHQRWGRGNRRVLCQVRRSMDFNFRERDYRRLSRPVIDVNSHVK